MRLLCLLEHIAGGLSFGSAVSCCMAGDFSMAERGCL